MCGSARRISSPLSSRIRRSTPWAAGCWGPKLTGVSAVVGDSRFGDGARAQRTSEVAHAAGGRLGANLLREDLLGAHLVQAVVSGRVVCRTHSSTEVVWTGEKRRSPSA